MARYFRWLPILMACLAVLVLAMPAGAQETASTAALPEPLTREAVREMVARMSDDQVRDLLLTRLDAVATQEAAPAPVGIVSQTVELTTRVGSDLWGAVQGIPQIATLEAVAISNFASEYGRTGLLRLFGVILAALAAGVVVELIVSAATRRWQGREPSPDHHTLWASLHYLFRRLLRDLAGLIGFALAVRVTAGLLLDPQEITFAAPFLIYLIWIPRVGAAISRFVLAPHEPALRLVNIDDRGARYLYRNLIGLFLLSGAVIFILTFNNTNGVGLGDSRIGFWLNTAVHAYIALIAWRARDGLTQMMRGSDPDRTLTDERVAWAYPYFAIAVSALMWLAVEIAGVTGRSALLAHAPHYVTMFWLLMAPVLDTVIRALAQHLQLPMIGDGAVAERAYKATRRSLIRIGRVLVAGIVLIVIANAWGIDLFALFGGDDGAGANLFQFLITLAIGYILFEVVSLWINRRLARERTARQPSQDEAAGEGGGTGGSRLATVLPLLRMTSQAAIVVIFILLALGNIGIDITPLLAGAGILGLAIGFGAQKLVSDVVSGIFFLIDDAFRIGEYVEISGTAGTVEKISIRSMQLRHHRGPVHTIPYGEISKLTNYSRDWVIMKLKFTVPFDTDPNKVKKIFKKIGAEMMEEPLYKEGFLEPFKSQGVFDFSEVGMVIRGKFMAKPGQQFTIRKEIYNRVKDEFGAAGIEFARPEVRIAMPEGHEEAGDAELQAAAKAAVRAQLAKKDAP